MRFHHLYLVAILLVIMHVPRSLIGFIPGILLHGKGSSAKARVMINIMYIM